MTEGDLGEGCRRGAAESVAEEGATAVTGGAASAAGGVEGAAVTAPDPAGPGWGEFEVVGFGGKELEATAAVEDRLAGAGLDSWPDWVGTLVVKRDCCCCTYLLHCHQYPMRLKSQEKKLDELALLINTVVISISKPNF